MLIQTELGFTEESWSKTENYCEDNILDSSTWPLQSEHTMNEAFVALMKSLPEEIVNSKNLSELEILVLAMEYIKGLESVLDKDVEVKE